MAYSQSMVPRAGPPADFVSNADQECSQAELGHGDQRHEQEEERVVVVLHFIHGVGEGKQVRSNG